MPVPAFDGLNLCFETREGILKHCSAHNARLLTALEPEGPAQRFIAGLQPSLEAQLVNLADEIAYSAHDIDDGVRSGLLTLEQMAQVPLFARWRDAALGQHPSLAEMPGRRLLFDALRRLLSALVGDLVANTTAEISTHVPADCDAVRALPPLVRLGAASRAELTELRQFLFRELYRHPQVLQVTDQARGVVTELFGAYIERPREMPAEYASSADLPRSVADYVAGMTDRFAVREHHRLTGRRAFEP